MNLQQLRYLNCIVDNGLNISRASEVLHTSQPGISKQIKLLEEELGTQLFIRKGKHLQGLTASGQAILVQARQILQCTQTIVRTAEESIDATQGSLTLATTHTQSRYLLPPVISRFVSQYPDVSLHMHQGSPMQIAELTARGEADFAIATEAMELFDSLVMMPCFHWNRSILVPRGHPLAELKTLSLEAIAAYPIVTYVFGFTGRSKLDQAFSEAGLQPRVVFTATDADVIKTYVRLGMGIGIIASMAYEAGRDSDLLALNASHLFAWSTTSIGFRRNSLLRGYMLDFIALFAPHLTRELVERYSATNDSAESAALSQTLNLPYYGKV